MSTTLTTARTAAERLASEIQDRDLAGLMPPEIRYHTRMQQLIDEACSTILDPSADDELACGCASDLVKLLLSFSENDILFERVDKKSVSVLLRQVKIRSALEAAAIELDAVKEVLA
jgi:hypothetical protein